jgi:hypothetical protein
MWRNMIKQIPSIKNMQIVPEEIVKYCADHLEGEENTFEKFLSLAEEFRSAGLTPIFMCSSNLKDLFITTEEKLKRKLH